jgi:pimeloyl-ACP methyl ester carboxylesterase
VLTSTTTRGAGADLYHERRGAGPALLLVVGGGGDHGYYDGLAEHLAGEFTVLTYDRRGNSRSVLHGAPAPLEMAEQSADALAVLDAHGIGPALVFGNSGGASIALDLAARHPGRVTAAVVHEPPVPAVLPGPGPYRAIADEIGRLTAAEGWAAAFTYFQVTLGQVSPEVSAVMLDPAPHLPAGPVRDLLMRVSRNWEFMTRYEIRSFLGYHPDLAAIAANGTPVALACGAGTTDPDAVRMSQLAAARLGAECVVFPGGHTAPLEVPGAFGAVLRDLLRDLPRGPQHRLRPSGGG